MRLVVYILFFSLYFNLIYCLSSHIFKNVKNDSHLVTSIAFWHTLPVFPIVDNIDNVSKECQIATRQFLMDLRNFELSALKIFDASAKPSSGVLEGNLNTYGNFDECFRNNGKYCLAEIDVLKLKLAATEYFPVVGDFNDPGHRVAAFNLIKWGFCIPVNCTENDLENSLTSILKAPKAVKIRQEMCQFNLAGKNDNLGIGYYFSRLYFFIIIFLVILSTICHKYLSSCQNKKMDLLLAFSIQKNWEKLWKLNESTEKKEISGLHGVRFLNALCLIIFHKSAAISYNPYINKDSLINSYGGKWTIIGRTSILYTDSFLLISGLLNANSLLQDLETSGRMKFKDKFINRLFRILPTLLTVILFCTYHLPTMGSGPLWPLLITHHAELCKKSLWRNLLFIHNYFGFENMCLPHTHQIGIDMQLFLITPLLIGLVRRQPKNLHWIMWGAIGLSAIVRFVAIYTKKLFLLVYFGVRVSKMYDSANFSYILPSHRASVYFIGVYLAYLIRNYCHINKRFFKVIWFGTFLFGFYFWLGYYHTTGASFRYDNLEAAIYGALASIFWGLPVAWTIFCTNLQSAGWLGRLLTWKYFELFTRISYPVYLVQFPMYFYNVASRKFIGEFSIFSLFDLNEIFSILIVSMTITLCVEMPFQNLRQLFIQNDSKKMTDVKEK